MNSKKIICIGIPTRGKICMELASWLCYQMKKSCNPENPFELQVMISKGSPQNDNNNQLAESALKNSKFDYYLKIDDDIVPDENMIERMFKQDKDVIGAAVAIWRETAANGMFICCNRIDPVTSKYYLPDVEKEPIGKCDYVGGGVIMVKRKVLEAMKQPFWKRILQDDGPSYVEGSDERFCRIAREMNFEVWYDATIIQGQHTDLIVRGVMNERGIMADMSTVPPGPTVQIFHANRPSSEQAQ